MSSCFNPRPPLLASVCAMEITSASLVLWFQSAPAIAGERVWMAAVWLVFAMAFQSAPAIAGERVSVSAAVSRSTLCFNPRPPLLASV